MQSMSSSESATKRNMGKGEKQHGQIRQDKYLRQAAQKYSKQTFERFTTVLSTQDGLKMQ